jgi:hypothetical protein
VGRPCNSLEKDLNYQPEKDMDNWVGFEVLMAASMKMAVFWVVASCSLLPDYMALQPRRQPTSTWARLPKTAGTLMLNFFAYWDDMTGRIWAGGGGMWVWGWNMSFGLPTSPTFNWLMYHPWKGMITLHMDCTLILEAKESLYNSLPTGLGVSKILERFLWSLVQDQGQF